MLGVPDATAVAWPGAGHVSPGEAQRALLSIARQAWSQDFPTALPITGLPPEHAGSALFP